jgi:hypothetical protein
MKTFTLELSPVSVEIEAAEGLSDIEALKLAEQEVIKKLSKKFPYKKYGVVGGTLLLMRML